MLCMQWLMNRSISLKTLTIPKFETRSIYPHFSQPKLLAHLHTLKVLELRVRDGGWWETLICACTSLIYIHLRGRAEIVFQAMGVVAQHSPHLKTLKLRTTLENNYRDCSEVDIKEDFTRDVQAILKNCADLREVNVVARHVPSDVVHALTSSDVAFFIAFYATVPYGELLHNGMIINNMSVLCAGMSHKCIAQCIHAYLPGPDYERPHTLWMSKPLCSFDYVRYLCKLTRLWSVELNDCREMTAKMLTLILQNSRLKCAKLDFNDTISAFTNDVVWRNRRVQDIELRAFTALTYRTVQRITMCCPLVTVVTVDMPRMPGELHGHVNA